ncbi:MAG: thiamine pyrophosphate-dependent dehydrogenase E1 component subunit alpha [Armatimonadetes bacterium]|nr:thiamine pyrophosphate-dependent dehydrogenase E1 component subunit alpha [Armatimonadota bacterium]
MMLIRHFEERSLELFTKGELIGMCHVSVGQEAVAVGVCSELRGDDYVASTHRGHGHSIAKGADIGKMFAELLGREAGYCKGRGGSMHMADVGAGFLGCNGIVGAGIPIAVGAGLSIKLRKTDQISVVFFGDGATNIGAFHEALNMASAFNLPVLFVCEDNMYALSTKTGDMSGAKCNADKGTAYCMRSRVIDGMDVYAVRDATRELISAIRAGEGPAFLDCKTYRYYGHSKSDTRPYRTKEEEAEWRSRDCITTLADKLTAAKLATAEEIEAVEADAARQIEESIEWARQSPFTNPEEVSKYVFAE